MKKQNHTSHIAPHTSQKGITLIALIITIIVMLILVGVTINVALNGGLFQKAEYASEQMQIEAEKEELLSAVVAAIGNDGKIGNIVLPEGWSKLADGNYRSPKDNMYKVDDYGKIEYIGKYTGEGNGGNTPVAFTWSSVNLGNVDTSAEYKGYIAPLNMTVIVSFTEDGKLIMHEGGYVTEIDAKDPDNIDDTTKNLRFSLKINGADSNIIVTMNEDNTNIDALIEVLGPEPITYVKQEKTIYTNEEVLNALGITNSTGTYSGTWTVLGRGADGKPTKLVSTKNVTTYTLGYNDPRAIEAIAIEGSEPTEEENLERAIWSYKNVVNTLNTVAKEATGITNARSITLEDIEELAGIEDSDKGNNYNQTYTYNYTNSKDHVFVTESGDTVKIDSEGKEVSVKQTYYYKELSSDEIGILASGSFWLASPCVNIVGGQSVYFDVFEIDDEGDLSHKSLFAPYGWGTYYNHSVRAVVSI